MSKVSKLTQTQRTLMFQYAQLHMIDPDVCDPLKLCKVIPNYPTFGRKLEVDPREESKS